MHDGGDERGSRPIARGPSGRSQLLGATRVGPLALLMAMKMNPVAWRSQLSSSVERKAGRTVATLVGSGASPTKEPSAGTKAKMAAAKMAANAHARDTNSCCP